MKALPFPYYIAAELWLFGPPARKSTLFHLLILIGTGASGIAVFLALRSHTNYLLSILCAIPIGLSLGYCAFRLFAFGLPLIHWLVSRGIIQEPDEERLESTIKKSAFWES
ncbi:MAG: hypothetical protein Q7Q73_16565 [Verrucomicrobiota bacterium JB024]|nr:hypothetical protein [Verrucomicrobiota bacterium JB024]